MCGVCVLASVTLCVYGSICSTVQEVLQSTNVFLRRYKIMLLACMLSYSKCCGVFLQERQSRVFVSCVKSASCCLILSIAATN